MRYSTSNGMFAEYLFFIKLTLNTVEHVYEYNGHERQSIGNLPTDLNRVPGSNGFLAY